MNRVSFFTGQSVSVEDLQYLQTSLADQIKTRTTDQFSKGVVSAVGDYVAVDINTETGVPTMKFLPFAAYTASGERIDVYQEIRQLALDLTKPGNRELGTQGILDNDSFGWETNIPYTICVKYIERAGRPRPNVNTHEPYGSRIYSGFKFYAFRTNIDPLEENGINPYIILASAIYTGDKLVITNKGVTQYAGIDASRVVVPANNSTTTNYDPFGETSAQQHIRCIGDPDFVSDKNPHGLTPKILGIDSNAVPEHEKLFHSSGFIGDPGSLTSCLYSTINARNLSVDEIVVYNFSGSELLNYQGKSINNLRYGQTRLFIDLEDESGKLPSGTYIVYVNVNDGSLGIASQEQLATPRTFKLKYSAYGDAVFTPEVVLNKDLDTNFNCRLYSYTFVEDKVTTNISLGIPGIPKSNFTNKQDFRLFGSIAAINLQRNYQNIFITDFPIKVPSIVFNDGTSLSTATSYPDGYISASLLPRYISGTTIMVSPGRCKDSTNSKLMVLNKQLSKIITVAWTEGDGRGGLAPSLKLAAGTWHIFLVGQEGGVCDVAFDTSLKAENLVSSDPTVSSPLSGYRYYRRIGSIYISSSQDTSKIIPEFMAISDGGNGINMVYLSPISPDLTNYSPAEGGYLIKVPSGITLKATLNAQSVPADFTTGSFITGTAYKTRRNVSEGEFTGFTDTGRLPFAANQINTAQIYVDSYFDKRVD